MQGSEAQGLKQLQNLLNYEQNDSINAHEPYIGVLSAHDQTTRTPISHFQFDSNQTADLSLIQLKPPQLAN